MTLFRRLLLFVSAAVCASLPTRGADGPGPDSALQLLKQGNYRFANGIALRPDQTIARREEIAGSEHPFAVVLACSDSRIPPELYFDQGLGDLFVIRNAGHVVDDHVLGSIEYAVESLHARLIVVLGHQRCGAIAAAAGARRAPGHIGSLLTAIEPDIEQALQQPDDRLGHAAQAHARATVAAILHDSTLLRQRAASGEIRIIAAFASLDSGQVEFLP